MTVATVGSTVVDVLAAAGVRRFYTVPGESFLEILDVVEQHPDLTLVSARHEGGAGLMAEADAKVCGVPAVAMATRGVGAANLAIGVHTAYQDSTPLIALLGHVETDFLHREAFQEVDLTAFYAPITKWAVTASRADRLPELVARAVRIATTGRPGPVMVALPADLLAEAFSETAGPPAYVPALPKPTVDRSDAESISQRLAAATAPLIIAGGGAKNARAQLIELAETYSAGVYAGFRRQDVFPNDHPLYLGHLSVAPVGRTLESLETADVVLVIGCRLSEITTQRYRFPTRGTDVIQIDIDPASIGAVSPLVAGLVADAGKAIEALLAAAPADRPQRDWSSGHEAWTETTVVPAPRSKTGVDPAQVMAALERSFPADTIITNDAGNFAAYVHRYWRFNHANSQLGPTNGAMGYAIPAAIAAKLARPERTVVATVGDGGFLMTANEIEVAVRHHAAITVLAFRNGLYGTIAMHQATAFARTAGTDIGEVDIAGFARSLGAEAIIVESNDDLDEAFEKAAASDRVTVLDLICDPDLITPTSRLSDLLGVKGSR